MRKEQLKAKLEKIKAKGKEGREKIKKIVIKRKDDFLTALEKNWRDWSLKPLTTLFYKIGITANQITYLGFILIAIAIWLYFQDYHLQWQLLILILAGITDILDGSTARNNDNVTIRGTWLDHVRDGFLIIWASFLIYQFNLLNLEIILIMLILQALLIWIIVKDFLIRYLQGLPDEQAETLVSNFSLDNLQASVIGRIQFFCWTVGYGFLLASLLLAAPILITIGHTLITLTIIFAALSILEAYQKTI